MIRGLDQVLDDFRKFVYRELGQNAPAKLGKAYKAEVFLRSQFLLSWLKPSGLLRSWSVSS